MEGANSFMNKKILSIRGKQGVNIISEVQGWYTKKEKKSRR